jgi:hypothetical protein
MSTDTVLCLNLKRLVNWDDEATTFKRLINTIRVLEGMAVLFVRRETSCMASISVPITKTISISSSNSTDVVVDVEWKATDESFVNLQMLVSNILSTSAKINQIEEYMNDLKTIDRKTHDTKYMLQCVAYQEALKK